MCVWVCFFQWAHSASSFEICLGFDVEDGKTGCYVNFTADFLFLNWDREGDVGRGFSVSYRYLVHVLSTNAMDRVCCMLLICCLLVDFYVKKVRRGGSMC